MNRFMDLGRWENCEEVHMIYRKLPLVYSRDRLSHLLWDVTGRLMGMSVTIRGDVGCLG